MARIAGVDLPRGKRIDVALTYLYGVGSSMSAEILKKANIAPATKVSDISEGEVVAIRNVLKDFKVEGDLRREVAMNIKRLQDLGTYRGSRHKRGLPARGQRTKTNARTKRGKRKTVGSGKKKEETKE